MLAFKEAATNVKQELERIEQTIQKINYLNRITTYLYQ